MSKCHEAIDLKEIIYCRYNGYNHEHMTNSIHFVLRGSNAEVYFQGDVADFMFEQYSKYKKRGSIASHTTITKGKSEGEDDTYSTE